MHKIAVAELPLHPGRAPSWLFKRMVALSKEVFKIISDEFSPKEVLSRISDPFWFQALSMLLGFDWHSSGTTTVTLGALSEALSMEEHGIEVLGGKGSRSRKVPEKIDELVKKGLLNADPEELKRSSILAAKVDSAALQDGYPLYHHSFIVDIQGNWAVIQQGMNGEKRLARRYHWLKDGIKDFTQEPHSAILGNGKESFVLDLTALNSANNKKALLDLINEGPGEVKNGYRIYMDILHYSQNGQASLDKWCNTDNANEGFSVDNLPRFFLKMPYYINWDIIKKLYDFQPSGFEEVLQIKGVGPSLVRSLSLTAQLIYGEPPSWRDPVKYSFAVGGKDGVPYPVDRRTYDQTVDVLRDAVYEAKVGRKEKLLAIRGLSSFLDNGEENLKMV